MDMVPEVDRLGLLASPIIFQLVFFFYSMQKIL